MGTRTGDVFRIVFPGPGERVQPEKIRTGIRGGVLSIVGCPECPGGAVIGSGDRQILAIASGSADREIAKTRGRIGAIRRYASRDGSPVLVVADDGFGIHVFAEGGDRAHEIARHELDWTLRWIDTDARVAALGEGKQLHWLMVSADGRIARAWLFPERGALHVDQIQLLDAPPRCVTFFDHGAGERAILFADDRSLRLAVLGASSPGKSISCLEKAGIHHVAVRRVFDATLVIACAQDGWVGTLPCPLHTSGSPHQGTDWPRLGADALGVWIGPHHPEDDEAVALALTREHRVFQIAVYNRARVREALQAVEAWAGESDAERFAQLTVSPGSADADLVVFYVRAGGQRTLDGAMSWLRRAAPGRLDGKRLVEFSAEVLIAASIMGPEAVVQRARELRDHLFRRMQSGLTEPADQLVQRWWKFLNRYFLEAGSLLKERWQLENVVQASGDRSAEAFIHAARLGRQGFDVLQDISQAGVWALAVDRTDERTCRFAVSAGDGSIWEAEVQDSGEMTEPRSILPGRGRTLSGPYTRVLAYVPGQAGGAVLAAAPRGPIAEGMPLKVPRWPERSKHEDDQTHIDRTQVYSLHPVEEGLLLGTRSLHRPFALWNPAVPDEAVEYIDATLGVHKEASGVSKASVRRVWSITDLCRGWLAVGAQDGYLRLMSWASGGSVDPGRVRSLFLGSPIRALVRFGAGQRTFLAAGTEAGHLFVFEVQPERPTELPIKFREVFRSPIVSLFTDGEHRATRLFVLDHGGRLTSFDVGVEGSFLGKRNRHYDVCPTASAAAWLRKDAEGRDMLLIGGWDRKQRMGVLRIIRILDHDRSYLQSMGPALRSAREAAERFAPGREDALLASLPLPNASVRAALVRSRVSDIQTAIDRIPIALNSYPNDIEEVKALLDVCRACMDSAVGADAEAPIRVLFERVIEHTGRFGLELSMSAPLRGAAVRRLLGVRVLRAWRGAGLAQEKFYRWLQIHLQDPEPYVRHEMMRVLAESFHGLVRIARIEPRAVEEAFPPLEGLQPWEGVTSLISHHLYTHQQHGSAYDCEIDSMGWSATSVLVSLLRLFADSTLTILAHLSAHRVPSAVIQLVRRRLRSPRDTEIIKRINYFLPWDEGEATYHDLVTRSSGVDRDRLRTTKDSPDAIYLKRSERLHKLFHSLLLVGEKDMPRLLDESRKHSWEFKRRNNDGEAGHWIEDALRRLVGTTDDPVEAEERSSIVSSSDHDLWTRAGRLPSPEREMAIGVLTHWRRILVPEMPREGQFLDKEHRLGRAFQTSPTVFSHQNPMWLIAVFVHKSRARAARTVLVWKAIQRLCEDPSNRLVKIVAVVDATPFPGLVMEKLNGQNLTRLWKGLFVRSPRERAILATNLFTDGWTQLDALHQKGLYHGDIQRRNIVAVDEDGALRFYLVDFDRAGSSALDGLSPAHSGDSETDAERQSTSPIWQVQQEERAALLDIAVHLLAGEKDVHTFQPSSPPDLEDLGDERLTRSALELIDEWRRARSGSLVAILSARQDKEHVERLQAQLAVLSRLRGFNLWSEWDIPAGADVQREVERHLGVARVIVLVVSADLINECAWQLQIARKIHALASPPIVVPIIVRSVNWRQQWFGNLKHLPTEDDAVVASRRDPRKDARNLDEVWCEIAKAIDELFAPKTK